MVEIKQKRFRIGRNMEEFELNERKIMPWDKMAIIND